VTLQYTTHTNTDLPQLVDSSHHIPLLKLSDHWFDTCQPYPTVTDTQQTYNASAITYCRALEHAPHSLFARLLAGITTRTIIHVQQINVAPTANVICNPPFVWPQWPCSLTFWPQNCSSSYSQTCPLSLYVLRFSVFQRTVGTGETIDLIWIPISLQL